MIIHVTVPILRHSLSPKKSAEHMSEMLDPERDVVQSVIVTEEGGSRVEVWSRNNDVEGCW